MNDHREKKIKTHQISTFQVLSENLEYCVLLFLDNLMVPINKIWVCKSPCTLWVRKSQYCQRLCKNRGIPLIPPVNLLLSSFNKVIIVLLWSFYTVTGCQNFLALPYSWFTSNISDNPFTQKVECENQPCQIIKSVGHNCTHMSWWFPHIPDEGSEEIEL